MTRSRAKTIDAGTQTDERHHQIKRSIAVKNIIGSRSTKSTEEEVLMSTDEVKAPLSGVHSIKSDPEEDGGSNYFNDENSKESVIEKINTDQTEFEKVINDFTVESPNQEYLRCKNLEEMASDECIMDLLFEGTIFDIHEVADSAMATQSREKDYVGEENLHSTNSNCEHLQQNDDGKTLTLEMILGSNAEDIICKIIPKEFQKINPNDEDGEVDGNCNETFYETMECNCNHEIFYELLESVPVIGEYFSDVIYECYEPDEDYDYFSATDGESETDLEDTEPVLSSFEYEITKKNRPLSASRVNKKEKVCISKDKALRSAEFPKNCESSEEMICGNEASEPMIISQPEAKRTGNETLPPGKIEFYQGVKNELVQQSHHIKEEIKEVTIQDNFNMIIIQESFSCKPLQTDNQFSKCSRNNNNYPELPLNVKSETAKDSPLSLDLIKTGQNGINKTQVLKIQKSVQLPHELVSLEHLYETPTTESHNAEFCLDDRKLKYILCTNLSKDNDNSLDRYIKAFTNSSEDIENPHNFHQKTCQQSINSKNTHTQPRSPARYSDIANYHQSQDPDVQRSTFIDHPPSTLNLCREEKPQIAHIKPTSVKNQTSGNSWEGNCTFEMGAKVPEKCIKHSSKAESSNGIKTYCKSRDHFDLSKMRIYQYRNDLYQRGLYKSSLYNEDNEVKEFHVDAGVDAHTYAVKETLKQVFNGQRVHFQLPEYNNRSKRQNMPNIDDIPLTLLKELENNRTSEAKILQCQSNENDIRSNDACIDRTVNAVDYTSYFEFQTFQAPPVVIWTADIIRTDDGNVFSMINIWLQFTWRIRITCLLESEKIIAERNMALVRKRTCTESKMKSWKRPQEDHLHKPAVDPGNGLIEFETAEESPSVPGTGENTQHMADSFYVGSNIDIQKELTTRGQPEEKTSQKGQPVNKEFGAGHMGTFSNPNPNFRPQFKINSKPSLKLKLQRQNFGHSINIACADVVQTHVQVGDENSTFQTGLSNGIDGEVSKDNSSPYWFGKLPEMRGNYQHMFDQVRRDFKSEPPGSTMLDELDLSHHMKTDFQMLYLIRDPGNSKLIYILHMKLYTKGFLMTELTEKKSSVYSKGSVGFFCDGGTIYFSLDGNNSKNRSELLIQVGTDNVIGLNQEKMAHLEERIWFIPWEVRFSYHSPSDFSSWIDGRLSLDQLAVKSLSTSSEHQRRHRQYMTCEIKLSVFLKQSLFELAVQKAANRCICSCHHDKYSHLSAQYPYTTVDQSTSARQPALNIDVHKLIQKVERLPKMYEFTDTGNLFKQSNIQTAMNSDFKGLFGLGSYCEVCQNLCTFSAQSASRVGCSPTQDAQSARNSCYRPSFESRTSDIYLDILGSATKIIVDTLHSSDSFNRVLDFLGLEVHHVSESGSFVFSSDNIVDVVDKLNDTEQYINDLLFVILEGLELADDVFIYSKDSFTPEFHI